MTLSRDPKQFFKSIWPRPNREAPQRSSSSSILVGPLAEITWMGYLGRGPVAEITWLRSLS